MVRFLVTNIQNMVPLKVGKLKCMSSFVVKPGSIGRKIP